MALVSFNYIVSVKTIANHPYSYQYLQDPRIAEIVTRIFVTTLTEFIGVGMEPPEGTWKQQICKVFPLGIKFLVICHENTFESWAQGMIQSISSPHIELNIS